MFRRLAVLTALWLLVLALLSTSTARAQDDGAEADEPVTETLYYGDSELIETLRSYDLLDDWIVASPVSASASMLLVTNNAGYQAQRQAFLDSLDTWARSTDRVRNDLAEIDAAQANADRLRSIITQVRDALILDDRLAVESNTLMRIEDALGQFAFVQIPEHSQSISEDPLTLAEVQLNVLRELALTELLALNGSEPALSRSGIDAFVGFDDRRADLDAVDLLLKRARDSITPALEASQRLVATTLRQLPNLHATRMRGSSEVGGMSVVTVDAYIRAGARSSCSVDWALLAAIGKIESNHGQLGGASVSASGQVSTTIFGPLLDGGETARGTEEERQLEAEQRAAVAEAQAAARVVTNRNSLWALLRGSGADLIDDVEDQGNGFAVVVDSDDGQLDGNDQWDRAIGPMQFLPETWRRWATDGNGDGVADPHNLYDAAASAGRFLCALSTTRGPSPSSFVLGYNPSTTYVNNVLTTAEALRARTLPDP